MFLCPMLLSLFHCKSFCKQVTKNPIIELLYTENAYKHTHRATEY